MSRKKEDFDFLDDLFDRHLNDDQFINSTVNDFGKMIRDSFNAEAHKSGYDNLQDMIQGEIQNGLNGTKDKSKAKTQSTVRRSAVHYETRYDYFMDSIFNFEFGPGQRGNYKEGHEDAINRYVNRVELNRSNLCAVEKIVDDEIQYYRSKNRRIDKYTEGYLNGLKFVRQTLIQSKCELMEEVSHRLSQAIKSL